MPLCSMARKLQIKLEKLVIGYSFEAPGYLRAYVVPSQEGEPAMVDLQSNLLG